MIHSLPSILLTAALLTGTIPAIQAQVIVEAPEAGSGLKWFEFAGGTPAQLVEELQKTLGSSTAPSPAAWKR